MANQRLVLSAYPLVVTDSIDEAQVLLRRMDTSVELDKSGRAEPFEWRTNGVSVGMATILSSSVRAGVRARTEPVHDVFTVAFTSGRAAGEALYEHRAMPMVHGRRAFIASPFHPVSVRLEAGYRGMQVLVRRDVMESALSALTGAPVRTPLQFEPGLVLDAGIGAAMSRLLHFTIGEVDRGGPLLASVVLASCFSDALLHLLLTGQPHNHRALLEAPVASGLRHVRRAEEYVATHAHEAIRLVDLAAASGVGARSLQAAFLRHRGFSPMDFLRERRLELARARLLAAPPGTTVAQAAFACGFEHLGRFSASYRARFGELPATTLRGR